MPLDEIGRRYADSIFQRRLHEISGSEELEVNQLRNQHAARGSLLSGNYIYDHFKLLLKRIDTLAQAKADGLERAYESPASLSMRRLFKNRNQKWLISAVLTNIVLSVL